MTGSLLEAIRGIERYRTLIAICIPLLGGVLVVASSVLMPRGKAKGLLTGAFMLLASLGVACLFFALAGAITGVPFSMISPLLVLGIVLTGVMSIFTPEAIREYQRFEIRKLAAEIFRRS
jgi:drug/metabolite transporter (DMT)-like permease